MKAVHMIAFILVIIGGLNWGLVGAFNFNLVSYLLGSMPVIANTVYVLVGISAIVLLVTHKKSCKDCVVEKTA